MGLRASSLQNVAGTPLLMATMYCVSNEASRPAPGLLGPTTFEIVFIPGRVGAYCETNAATSESAYHWFKNAATATLLFGRSWFERRRDVVQLLDGRRIILRVRRVDVMGGGNLQTAKRVKAVQAANEVQTACFTFSGNEYDTPGQTRTVSMRRRTTDWYTQNLIENIFSAVAASVRTRRKSLLLWAKSTSL